MKPKYGFLDMVIIVGVCILALKACGNAESDTTDDSPRPGTTAVCNEYFKGGC